MSLNSVEAIFEIEKGEIERQFSPYFYTYFQSIFEFPRRAQGYPKMCKEIFDTTEARGKQVLDVGCGFGFVSIYLAIFGAGKVTSIDPNEEKIRIFKKILSRFDPPLDNVEAKAMDALDLADETFDVVIAHEVISHIRDVDAFLSKVNRVLRNGGVFFISDGNNALNVIQDFQRRRIWRRAEFGPVGEGLELSYREMRWKMIREAYPQLDNALLKVLANETAGYWGVSVTKAVEEYLEKGRIAQKPSFKFRNPVTGEYPEFEFNPYKLRNQLQRLGFSAKILRLSFSTLAVGIMCPSFLRRFLLNSGVGFVRLFHPISLVISPQFMIVAEKKHGM
jgi:SAM-dependent methyltransferase